MADPKSDTGGDKRTLVEEGTEFKGSLSSNCPILVKGRIEGEVTAPSLTVSPSGAVHGRAKVGEIRSQGELSGEFDADTVQLSGTVKDRTIIRAKSLEVKLAPANGKLSVVFGECELDVGEAPGKADDVTKGDVVGGAGARAGAPKRGGGTIPPPPVKVESDTGLR